MGSKFVTLGSKVTFLGGNIFIFLSSKSGQQKLFFWAARIIFLSSKNSYFEQQILKFEILDYLEKRFFLNA
jgi:hypothetical protein